jgi:hypothetical protein
MSLHAPATSTDPTAARTADRLRLIAADARAEMPPAFVAVLRALPPGARVGQAFALWRMARDALVRQGLRRGMTIDQARAAAAQRLLAQHDDPSA